MIKMGWKQWPYWMKGGFSIIGILIILLIIPDIIFPVGGEVSYSMMTWFLISSPVRFILDNIGLRDSNSTIMNIIFYFLLGALIGFIISKIKQKRRRI